MFRVYNPYNLEQSVSVASYPQSLDPRKYSWELPISDRNLAPLQFINWIKATITDDTWDEILRYKVMRNSGYEFDSVVQTAEYKAFKTLFANQAKWLIEFCHFNWDGSTRMYLKFTLPSLEGSSLEYYETHTSNRIPCSLTTDYGVTPVTQELVVDASHTSVTEFFTFLNQRIQEFLDEGQSRNRAKPVDTLTANNTFSMPMRMLFRTLMNVQTFKHTNSRGGNASVSPSQALVILNENPEAVLHVSVGGPSDWVLTVRSPRITATRNELNQIFNYSTNVLDLLPFNIRSKTEAKAPLYGIELEACSNYSIQQVIEAQSDLFFIGKQDGTITGSGAHKYELVTVPASFKAHKRLWADWFSKLDYTKFDTSKDTGNGMHIHIDRTSFFDTKHLNRFTWFIINPANLEFMFEISERLTKNELQRWAPMPGFSPSRSKIYCMRNAAAINRGLRGAIHFKNNKTVEVRLFKGVVSYATILKNLEFVDSVFHYTAETTLQHVNLNNYLTWLKAQPVNRYTALREFLAQLKTMDNLLFSNQIKEYLFNINQPDAILAKLNKAPFSITSKHITAINRERRKRTFILNKDGTISLAYNSGGKLASLDQIYQSKMTRGAQSLTVSAMVS